MIKVPENIKKAIRDCAEFENKANMNERIIYRWLEQMKLTEETCSDISRNMEDAFIDYCKMTNNPEEFIEVIENLK